MPSQRRIESLAKPEADEGIRSMIHDRSIAAKVGSEMLRSPASTERRLLALPAEVTDRIFTVTPT